jgi:hypothetical protein
MIPPEEVHRRKSLTAEDVENMRAESSEKGPADARLAAHPAELVVQTWVRRKRSSG